MPEVIQRLHNIFFAELDVIDSVCRGFGDFIEETLAARVLVAGEGGAVGDVVEQTFSHQHSAVSIQPSAFSLAQRRVVAQ